MDIAAGEVIGIVGRSGSGKSTLTKLVQRLYVPERGRVMVDGMDLALADSTSLRRQIGVVLQENLLFNRSIRENIAIADPAAPLEAVLAELRLVPDPAGPVTLLRRFGTVDGEPSADGVALATPLLIRAELLASGDARVRAFADEVLR